MPLLPGWRRWDLCCKAWAGRGRTNANTAVLFWVQEAKDSGQKNLRMAHYSQNQEKASKKWEGEFSRDTGQPLGRGILLNVTGSLGLGDRETGSFFCPQSVWKMRAPAPSS